MRKIVLTFGLICGAIMSGMMALAMTMSDRIDLDTSLILGYTSMVIAFLLIYFGVRAYRDNVGGGTVRFGRAFGVGMAIAAVAALCYAATWEVVYFKFMPDYFAKYSARVIEKDRQKGASETALAERKAEMAKYAEMYKNPFIVYAMTFMEPMPVALIVSLVTAGVLSRRRREVTDDAVLGAGVRT